MAEFIWSVQIKVLLLQRLYSGVLAFRSLVIAMTGRSRKGHGATNYIFTERKILYYNN